MHFQSPYNPDPIQKEVNNSPSMTEPDQTMSIPEIIQRFVRGLPVDAKVYPNISGMTADEEDFDFLDHSPAEFRSISPQTSPSPSEGQKSAKSPENADNTTPEPACEGAPT